MVASLSKLAEVEFELFGKRNDGRGVHGVVEPIRKVAVRKEIHAQHGGEHRQRPSGFGEMVQLFEQEQGNLGNNPNSKQVIF